MDDRTAARRALQALDLTNLQDECTPEDIDALVERADTPHGPVAALCIWPRFVVQARRLLGSENSIRIATVVNFPSGDGTIEDVVAETRQAIVDGADEIDLVIPYRALIGGDEGAVMAMVSAVRAASPGGILVKAILETGEIHDLSLIGRASALAIETGADFLKTSSGKTEASASLEAVEVMLRAIRDSGRNVGLKPSGGIGTVPEAAHYFALADRIMGEGWADPRHFRFGASGLLDDILRVMDGGQSAATGSGY